MWAKPRARRYFTIHPSTRWTFTNNLQNLSGALRVVFRKYQSDEAQCPRASPAIHLFARAQQSANNQLALARFIILLSSS